MNIDVTPADGVHVRIDSENEREPFVLTEPLHVKITGDEGSTLLDVTVPAGFRYDMASVPRWAWPFIPRTDPKIVLAATVHDYLYALRIGTRLEADAHFSTLMAFRRMPTRKRCVCYLCVRVFGQPSWDADDTVEDHMAPGMPTMTTRERVH